jgi:hypothetical protein
MNNKSFFFIAVVFLNFTIYSQAQQWTYKLDGNEFDGKYKVAKVIGSGGSMPYQSPVLIINYFLESKDLNIFIADGGYAGCDDKRIILKFDGDDNLYSMTSSTNVGSEVWFFDDRYSDLSYISLLEKLKSYSLVYMRLKSRCGQADYKFPLSGSTKAIDYVAADYIRDEEEATLNYIAAERARVIKENEIALQKQQEEERLKLELKRKQEEVKFKKERLSVHVDMGGKIQCISRYDASIYVEPNILSKKVGDLIKGESITLSKHDSNFYRLHVSTNFIDSGGKSTHYFITIRAVLDETCDIINNE